MAKLLYVTTFSLCALMLGCSTEMNKSNSAYSPDAAVVEFMIPIPSLTFVTTNEIQIGQIADWLNAAQATQLPSNKMRAVYPWCKITFLTLQTGAKRQMTAASIYKTDGESELLTAQQRRQLLDIFNLEELPTEPYIRERGSKR